MEVEINNNVPDPHRKTQIFVNGKLVSNNNEPIFKSPPNYTRKIRKLTPKTDPKFLKPLQDHFLKLDDSLILNIMSHLPKKSLGRLAVVNQRMNKLSKHTSLWVGLDVSTNTLTASDLVFIFSRQPEALRMSSTKILSDEKDTWCIEFPVSEKLTHLDLSTSVIPPGLLSQILRGCRTLKRVSFESLDMSGVFPALSVSAKTLKTIHMAMCTGVCPRAFATFLICTTELESLNMSWIVQNWDIYDMLEIINALPKDTLWQLCLAGYTDILYDEHIKWLVRRCSRIQHLDLSDNWYITGESIKLISRGLPYLSALAVNRCFKIVPQSLLQLVKLRRFQSLDTIKTYQDAVTLALITRFPKTIKINKYPFMSLCRPTHVATKKNYIWDAQVEPVQQERSNKTKGGGR